MLNIMIFLLTPCRLLIYYLKFYCVMRAVAPCSFSIPHLWPACLNMQGRTISNDVVENKGS